MNLTETWIQSSWMRALGWTFVHSIWQIALIGLLLFIVLRFIPGRSAHSRYTISTLALWTTLIAALSTFIIMLPEKKTITEVTGRVIMMASSKSLSLSDQWSLWFENKMPMMLTIWLGGVGILMLRLMISLGWVSHLRYDSYPEEQLQLTLNHIIARLNLKVSPITSESNHIKSPLTLGHFKPIILFPIAIVNQLTPSEVEAVLTHELAHIVRRDYISNLIQSFIETLFYYHPVTWWISRIVRTERENRADDLAVSWCGDHLGYAKALMTIQEMQIQPAPNLALGFASQKGAMLARIQRILNLPYRNHNQMEKTVLLSLCSLCFLAFTLTGQERENKKEVKSKIELLPSIKNDAMLDSIPSTGTYKIHKKTDQQDISIEVENGDIKELKIDGKDVSPSAYDQYDKVIDEMFSSVNTPPVMSRIEVPPFPTMPLMPPMPAMEGFEYQMPPMPPMPPMPAMEGFEYHFENMPGMSPLPELEHLRALELEHLIGPDGNTITIFNPEIRGKMNLMHDTTFMSGNNKIIIRMDNGDSSIICMPFHWNDETAAAIALDGRLMNADEMKEWAEQMQAHGQNWDKEWKVQAEQWKEQSKEWKEQSKKWNDQHKEQWKEQENQWRSAQDQYKQQQELWNGQTFQFDQQWNEDDNDRSAAEQELMKAYGTYEFNPSPSPRLSLSESMIADGIIEPGEEAQVQLTPDKLKINGHKMSDDLHAKYLRMYEQQQGVELTGNSRVEFTTKSKQRM